MGTKAVPSITAEGGPYVEMFDSLDPPSAASSRAGLLQNCYPLDAEEGEGVVGRPGFQVMGAQSPAGAVPGQGIAQFTKLDGTEYTVRIIGGRFQTFDWGTRTWTEVLSAGNLSGASITLSATTRVSMLTFANKLIVSDGVNTPWAWDGTTGGGLTRLSNCPPLYGPPTVASAKLLGIKATDRATLVWSEENDPTLGYQATVAGFTYANAWTLGQTDQNALVAVRGANTAIYYWRERSTGAIFGKINSTFVTSSTHDAISSSVGTKSPWGIVTHGEGFLFPDADGKPHRLIPGGGVVPVFQPFRETLPTIPRSQLGDALAIDFVAARLLLLGMTDGAENYPSAWLVYRDTAEGFKAAGLWRGWTSTQAAMVKNGNAVPTWVHLSSDGYAYEHGSPDGSLFDDQFVSGTVAITHVVQGSPMAGDPPRDAQFQRLDLMTRTATVCTVALDYETPRGRSTALSLTITPTASTNQYWDVTRWDVDSWAAGATEVHTAVGWSAVGRWVKPRLTHAVVGERFGFLKWRVTGVPSGTNPFTP